MQLRKIDTSRVRDVDAFVNFPFRLYQNNAKWVPPLVSGSRQILDRRQHPFYAHSAADFFVVEQNGLVVGRIAALENRLYNRYRDKRAAFFGYFETIEDEQVADLLFTAVFSWARKRHLTEMIGPRGVIGVDGSVLVDGFEHRPALTIPYNFPYYDRLIRQAEFTRLTDLLSGYISGNAPLPDRLYAIADRVKQRRGFWIKTFRSRKEIRSWIPRILAVHDEAFRQTRSYYPPTEAETAAVIQTVMQIADPQLVKLVMKDKKIVGFILAYPDISAGLQKSGGRIWPTGWAHLLHARRTTDWLNINGVGMLPAYQGLGGNAVLYTEIARTINAAPRFRHVDVVQVDEQNYRSFSDMESLGVRWYKRHRHYIRQLK